MVALESLCALTLCRSHGSVLLLLLLLVLLVLLYGAAQQLERTAQQRLPWHLAFLVIVRHAG